MKKFICYILSAVLLLSALSGCANNSANPSNQSSSSAVERSGSMVSAEYDLTIPVNLLPYYEKYDPPITLTQNVSGAEDETNFYPGDNWTDNQFTEWAEAVVGINWEPKWPAPDGETATQKLTLGMATGDLPDVIQTDHATIKRLAEAGAILEIDDLWEEYASPLVKELYADYDEVFDNITFLPVTINGKRMAIQSMFDAVGPSNIWYRMDILDELGKEIPKTIEELEEIFAAYKKIAPDNYCFMLNKDLYNVNNIFGAYGAYKDIWIEKDGKLVYSSVQPEVKDALATLCSWYEKGYIDKEFVVKDGAKVVEDIVAGKILCYEDSWATIWGTAPNTLKNLPDAVMDAGPLIKGPDGKSGSVQGLPYNNCWAISKNCKNPEAVIKQLNWSADSALRNEEEYRQRAEFVYPEESRKAPVNNETLISEGKDITYQESDYQFPGPGTGDTWYWNRGNNRIWYGPFVGEVPFGLSDEMKKVAKLVEAGSEGETKEEEALLDIYKTYYMGFDMLKVNGGNNAAYLSRLLETGEAKMNAFVGLPTQTMTEKKTYLDKIQFETYIKIITGEEPLDAFDIFVEEWNSNGGEAMTQEVNDWYDSIK